MSQMTTGASNDFEQATELATKMVSRWGMSDLLGPRVYGENQSEVFLGRDVTTHQNLSDETAKKVDGEISRIVEEQYMRARGILEEQREKVEVMAKALMEWETLDAKQIEDIMSGQTPRPPADVGGDKPKGSSDAQGGSARRPQVKPRMDKPAGDRP